MIRVITIKPISKTRLSIWFFRRMQKFKEKSKDFVLLDEINATEKSLRDNDEQKVTILRDIDINW